MTKRSTCRHCDRPIVEQYGLWIDKLATGDDWVWSESCDQNDDDFLARHEPREEQA